MRITANSDLGARVRAAAAGSGGGRAGDAGRRRRRPLERRPRRMRHGRRLRHQRRADLHLRRARRGSRRPQPAAQSAAAADGQGPADRPAAAAARRPGQGRRQLALRRRCAPSRTCCSLRSRMAPPGGRLRGFSRDAIAAVPGVRHVAARDSGSRSSPTAGGRRSARSRPPTRNSRARAPRRTCGRCSTTRWPTGDAQDWFSRGDYDGRDARLAAARRDLLSSRPSQHLGLEPLTRDRARSTATARALGADARRPGLGERRGCRRFIPMPPGEPAGRAMEADAAPIAVELARAAAAAGAGHAVASGKPEPRPRRAGRAGANDRAARRGRDHRGLEDAGRDRRRTRLGARAARRRGRAEQARRRPRSTARSRLIRFPTSGSKRSRPTLPFAAGYMRGSPQREFAFFTESFIDELAHAAGHGAARVPDVDARRQRRASRAACRPRRGSRNGTAAAPGSTMGIAGCSAFGSHIGLVATASIGDDQRVKVHRLVAAVDCGRVVNRGSSRQQIEARPDLGAGAGDRPRARMGRRNAARAADRRHRPAADRRRAGDRRRDHSEQRCARAASAGSARLSLAPAVANAIYAGIGQADALACRSILWRRMTRPADHPRYAEPKVGVLLINLGTPDAPEARAVRRYLAEFLSDPRVIEIPPIAWKPILHGIILRTRPQQIGRGL